MVKMTKLNETLFPVFLEHFVSSPFFVVFVSSLQKYVSRIYFVQQICYLEFLIACS